MMQTRWPQIRLGLFALLGVIIFGQWIYVLFLPGSALKADKNPPFAYPPDVVIPPWKLLKSEPLQAKKDRGYRYQYQKGTTGLEAQVWMQPRADGNVSRYLMVYDVAPPATAHLTIKQQPETGYYALTALNERVYLTACLNPVGQSTVTEAQMMKNLNQYGLNGSRLGGWLLGKNGLRDSRCLWTLISTAIADVNDDNLRNQKYTELETFWKNWYQWWKPQLNGDPTLVTETKAGENP